MYRTVGMAIIALAAITLPAETTLAASGGGKATAHAGTQNPPKATPQTKKLSSSAPMMKPERPRLVCGHPSSTCSRGITVLRNNCTPGYVTSL